MNISATDLTKIFDKVNLSLHETHETPNCQRTMSSCLTSVKCSSSWSHVFSVDSGVRHGAVLYCRRSCLVVHLSISTIV